MFFPSKRIYFEYQPLIVKMHVKSPINDIASKNLNVLCDVELILGLPCLLPLLKCVHKLIKIAQDYDVFVCDIVEVVKLAQLELYGMYCYSFTKFEDVDFDDFNAIGNLTNATMSMRWFFDLNGRKDAKYLAFIFSKHKYFISSSCIEGAKCRNPTLGQVWRWDSHSQKWELGVFRDSHNFRAQQQRVQHLALRCSLYCWKGLEV